MIVTAVLAALAIQSAAPQDPPPPAPPSEPAVQQPPQQTAPVATPPAGEEWHRVAATEQRAYLADINSIAVSGDVTTIQAASVPRVVETATDQTHSQDTYAFRCEADEFRVPVSFDHGPDGEVAEQFDEAEAAWEPLPRSGLPSFLKTMACDRGRSPDDPYPSIAAFIAGGRAGTD